MKQSLLTDIELDVQELRYLIDALSKEHNGALCDIAKRNILQMRSRLDILYEELSLSSEPAPVIKPQEQVEDKKLQIVVEPVFPKENVIEKPKEEEAKVETPLFVSDILKTDLRHSISLNDSFRFTRELFNGDSERMNRVVKAVDAMTSYDEAISYVSSETILDETNDAAVDFIELLKKRFM